MDLAMVLPLLFLDRLVLRPSRCSLTVQISPLYATVFVASMLFPALSTIFKEQIFTKAKETLKGKQLDIFVVRPPQQNPAL